ncbi:MAG TPA: DUF2254 domain-containing protein [Longimicrobium sp.]|nr:DUF2254 domain-containing protein [Longimicrobium sp.]
MLARMRLLWTRIRDSLWFLPGVFTLVAALLAVAVTEADRVGMFEVDVLRSWIFSGGVDGARGVLQAITGGLITVIGVVFSVTIVALQLASSQFTPRVLRNFTSDRGNQLVLAVFIGTFTYTLLVLRTVRSAEDGEEPFIPRVAVTLAVVLVLVAIGFLIFFINHSARSIQVAAILDRVSKRTLAHVRHLFPEPVGHGDDAVPAGDLAAEWATVTGSAAGYLQAVDGKGLFELGKGRSLVIVMEPALGDFVLPGEPLARVSPPGAVDEELCAGVRKAFLLGPERTPGQDVAFGLTEIADIAVKALSPGINDPTTAVQCIDRLAEILLELGTRSPPRPWRTEEGKVHYLARELAFERAVTVAFEQIRHFGASNPVVARALLGALGRLDARVPAGRRAVLREQADALLHDARARIDNARDLAGIEHSAGWVRNG